jgi:adhesin transport system outer membrane protein
MIKILLLLATIFNLYALESKDTIEVKSLSEDKLFQSVRSDGLSIYEAINRAIQISPKVNAASQVVIQDREKLHEVEAGHLPVVNFTGDAGYESKQITSDDNDPSNTPVSATVTKYKKADLYLTITENLWSGGSIENSIDEKDAYLKASLYDYRDKLEDLIVDVANSYFEVVYGEITLKIALKNMESYEKILNIVTIKEKNGAATKGDVNFISANVDNAKTVLVQKEKALADAIAKYEYLLETEDKAYMPYETESILYGADLNTSLTNADELNAKLLRQRAYIKATKFGFLATKKSFHPTVDFVVNGENRNEFDVGTGQTQKANALIMVSYNLYNGGRDEATAIRLFAKMKEQKYLYDDIERNLVFDVKVLNQSVSSLSQSLTLTESEVIAARKVVASYWVAFQHGTQDLQALQLAQGNLNRAEQDYATYKKDLILNNYLLMKNTGVLLKVLELPYKKNADEFQGDLNLFYQFSDLE